MSIFSGVNNPGIVLNPFTNAESTFLMALADHSYTDGQLAIGNSSTGGVSFATLTQGANVTITNGHGTITIASSAGATGLTVGSTAIASGTTTRILYDNAGTLGEYTITGTGTVVAMATSPSFTTPILGVASATSINKVAITAPATGATLVIADGKTVTHNATTTFAGTDGKTLTISNTLTLAGTDGTTMTFPGTSATIARTDAANTFTGHQTIEGVTSTGATGTGKLVFDTSPTLATAVLGSSTATTQIQNDNSTKLSTTAYVDLAVSNAIAGVNPAVAVQVATTAAADTSSLTYVHVAGIGDTFTGSLNTAITIDGHTLVLGDRVLVKNDTQTTPGSVAAGTFNGIYSVTTIQSVGVTPILTRVLDYDTPTDINNTGAIPVVLGTANATTSWILTSQITAVGTGSNALTYAQFSIAPSSVVTASSTNTFTNKTYDTAGTGNSFSINGVAATANTGTGAVARAAGPTFTTPTLGAATATTINGNTFTTGTYTLTGTAGKTLNFTNTITLSGTDSTTMTFPTTTATIARTDAANTFTGHQTIEGVTSTGATGTGKFVFDGTPTLVTPVLGVATATSINKVALTAPASSATLTIADGKTLTVNQTMTLTSSGTSSVITFPNATDTLGGLGATQTWTGPNTFNNIIDANNAITASGNAATVPVTFRVNTVTNNSAATLTITLTTSGAANRQMVVVCILDSSAATQTITWVNTENSTVSAPTTSNGSTTLPLTVGFQYNSATSKWRCLASV